MGRRSKNSQQKLRASLGDSWDDANYSTDGASTANHSEIELEPSDNELAHELDVGAGTSGIKEDPFSQPLPKDRLARSSRIDNDRTPRTSKPVEPLTQSEQPGPSFIMPKLEDSLQSSNGSPSRRPQIRSQNVRNRTPHLRTLDRSTTSYNPTSRAQPTPAPTEHQQSPLGFIYENFLSPVARYLVGVFGHTMGNLQPLFGLALAIGVLVFGVQLAIGSARSSLTMALTPLCLIPGSSYVAPFCSTSAIHDDQRVDFEGLLHAQTGLEDILDAAKDTSTLPSTIKDSELAIRDLRGLVRHSRLPSRHSLSLEFDNFIRTANDASMDLSRFNSRIGATVDRVIATNTWTRAVLSGISEQEASYGTLDRVYGALTRAFVAPPPTLHERIFDQYSVHVSKNAEEITKLIDTGVALHAVLQHLDEQLDTIYQIAINDDATITKNQEELLAQLWTIVGGNRSKLNTNNKKLMLLRNVSAYRKKALTHVSETLLKLREIQAELENLREGVEAPTVLGYRDDLPISYHLELIDKGVDRLRTARGESMRVEGETYRNLVGRGKEERRELPAPIVTAKVK
ncbi:uncharacterized protein M421DRAFT_272065 [Didymella exigua CBS 183.55]|uniref:Uncharacterized protein n=1 Tax=Didymella exigua CBS 183.55 TaxID=1150837 RepID=A0A6A5R9E7_9PLEO|nr:uncharacterized protein M421DRAFT_272065 [Didymella exigua CBS 183.55]KAF1924855.1 hypothetical protein M421DRAFT_272065 [Didymella exigua CBS 183.55]